MTNNDNEFKQIKEDIAELQNAVSQLFNATKVIINKIENDKIKPRPLEITKSYIS